MSTQIQISPAIHEDILEKNKRFWLTKYIFNKSFFDSSYDIFKQLKSSADLDYDKYRGNSYEDEQLRIQKFLISFCLTVCERALQRT